MSDLAIDKVNEEYEKTMMDWEMALSDLNHAVKMCEESSKRVLEVLKTLKLN